jgi:hypothetical protein
VNIKSYEPNPVYRDVQKRLGKEMTSTPFLHSVRKALSTKGLSVLIILIMKITTERSNIDVSMENTIVRTQELHRVRPISSLTIMVKSGPHSVIFYVSKSCSVMRLLENHHINGCGMPL